MISNAENYYDGNLVVSVDKGPLTLDSQRLIKIQILNIEPKMSI